MNQYHYALGRRKTSVARVRLTAGKGQWVINDKPAEDYFAGSQYLLKIISRPLAVTSKDKDFDVSVKINGGGQRGQADAISAGVAKALAAINDDLKGTLRRADLLGRDPRKKERKKFGLRGARKKQQFTKR